MLLLVGSCSLVDQTFDENNSLADQSSQGDCDIGYVSDVDGNCWATANGKCRNRDPRIGSCFGECTENVVVVTQTYSDDRGNLYSESGDYNINVIDYVNKAHKLEIISSWEYLCEAINVERSPDQIDRKFERCESFPPVTKLDGHYQPPGQSATYSDSIEVNGYCSDYPLLPVDDAVVYLYEENSECAFVTCESSPSSATYSTAAGTTYFPDVSCEEALKQRPEWDNCDITPPEVTVYTEMTKGYRAGVPVPLDEFLSKHQGDSCDQMLARSKELGRTLIESDLINLVAGSESTVPQIIEKHVYHSTDGQNQSFITEPIPSDFYDSPPLPVTIYTFENQSECELLAPFQITYGNLYTIQNESGTWIAIEPTISFPKDSAPTLFEFLPRIARPIAVDPSSRDSPTGHSIYDIKMGLDGLITSHNVYRFSGDILADPSANITTTYRKNETLCNEIKLHIELDIQ